MGNLQSSRQGEGTSYTRQNTPVRNPGSVGLPDGLCFHDFGCQMVAAPPTDLMLDIPTSSLPPDII